MNAITFIVIIGVLWAVRELIIGIVVRRSRRKYRHEYRVERTQANFASARNELMRLAMAGEIDVNSKSFRFFYFVNTGIMGRPDQYSEICHAMVGSALNSRGDEPDEQLRRESEEWSPAFKEVVKTTANSMDDLILNYSRVVRFMFWLERLHRPKSTPHHMLSRVAKKMEAKEKTVSEIRRTQQMMYRMAGT